LVLGENSAPLRHRNFWKVGPRTFWLGTGPGLKFDRQKVFALLIYLESLHNI